MNSIALDSVSNKTLIKLICCALYVAFIVHYQGSYFLKGFTDHIADNDIVVIAENNALCKEQRQPSSSLSFAHNSEKWLNNPRLQNIDEDEMTHDIVINLILKEVSPPLLLTEIQSVHKNNIQTIMEQTMCLQGSKFLNWGHHSQDGKNIPITTKIQTRDGAVNDDDDEYIKYLSHRLIYLALHEHQHRPARNEAIARYTNFSNNINDNTICDNTNNSNSSDSKFRISKLQQQKQEIGKFDFECPDTKFIVADLSGIGFGASIRLGIPDPLYLGIVSNRTVLFFNSLSTNITNNTSFTNPWPLASCKRKDYQCTYLPTSPCTITSDDLRNAPSLSPGVLKSFRKTGVLDEQFKDEKVIIIPGTVNGHKPIPAGLGDAFINIISSFYAGSNDDNATEQGNTNSTNDQHRILQKVYRHISNLTWWEWHIIALFYIIRPNYSTRKKIDNIIQNVFPQDFNFKSSIGLPIRGTDKCLRESECLTFDDYVQLIKEFSEKRSKQRKNDDNSTLYQQLYETVILTSESKEILQSRLVYTPKNETFPFDFIVNEQDVGQGTGRPSFFGRKFPGDDVMISSLVSLKMQLFAESLILNSCSNFHFLIGTFHYFGCGMNNYAEQLKDNDNPKFRLKCAWGK